MNTILCFMLVVNYLNFTVGPARIEKVLFSGDQITEVFEIQNLSNDSIRIKVEFEDFDIDKNGKVTFFTAGSFSNSVFPRTTVNPEEFFIAPQGIEYVRMTFQMPKDPNNSEYYGMFLVKSQSIPTKYKPLISVAGELGVPIYFSVANLMNKNAVFDSLYVLNDSVNIAIRNTGNIHLRLKGELKLLNTDGALIEKDSIPEFVVLPNRYRKLILPLKQPLDKGSYITRVRVDYGAVELLEAERRFIK